MQGLAPGILEYNQAPIYAAWDPLKKGGSITLSNSNKTAEIAANSTVLSTLGKTSGKWYWEVVIDSVVGFQRAMVGISLINTSYNNVLGGTSSTGWSYRRYDNSNDDKYHLNSGAAYGIGTLLNSGQTIGIALDMTLGQVTLYKNNVSQGVMYTGLLGSEVFAAIGRFNSGTITYTAHFNPADLTYAPPAGFNAGLYV